MTWMRFLSLRELASSYTRTPMMWVTIVFKQVHQLCRLLSQTRTSVLPHTRICDRSYSRMKGGLGIQRKNRESLKQIYIYIEREGEIGFIFFLISHHNRQPGGYSWLNTLSLPTRQPLAQHGGPVRQQPTISPFSANDKGLKDIQTQPNSRHHQSNSYWC